MAVETLREFLGWCTVINIGVLLFWFFLIMFAHDWVHQFHGKWFKLSTEKFDAIHYAGITTFKIAIFLFNVAPYFALHIVS